MQLARDGERIAVESQPPVSMGECGARWQLGDPVTAYYGDVATVIAPFAAQEAHINPDDPEAQERYAFWLEQVRHFSEDAGWSKLAIALRAADNPTVLLAGGQYNVAP